MSETIVIAETKQGMLHPVTAELVTAASALGAVPTLIVPGTDDSAAAAAADLAGVGRVIACVGDCFSAYDASSWAKAVDACAPAGIVVCAASQNG